MNKKIKAAAQTISVSLLLLPVTIGAQGFAQPDGKDGGPLGDFVTNIVNFTNGILLPAVLAIAFFVFVWGIFQYFIVGGANEEARVKGKDFMIYATLGFVFIVIFWGLVNFLATTIGLDNKDAITLPNTVEI